MRSTALFARRAHAAGWKPQKQQAALEGGLRLAARYFASYFVAEG